MSIMNFKPVVTLSTASSMNINDLTLEKKDMRTDEQVILEEIGSVFEKRTKKYKGRIFHEGGTYVSSGKKPNKHWRRRANATMNKFAALRKLGRI